MKNAGTEINKKIIEKRKTIKKLKLEIDDLERQRQEAIATDTRYQLTLWKKRLTKLHEKKELMINDLAKNRALKGISFDRVIKSIADEITQVEDKVARYQIDIDMDKMLRGE